METPIYHLEGVMKTRSAGSADFTGPLDLILHLLSRNRMEIRDIQISLILDQYLAWMRRRRELDLEVASEFAAMAAHLIYIKTRMLLSLEDEEARSEMDELVASLEARERGEQYRRIQAVVPGLMERYLYGRDLLPKEPEPRTPDRTYRYVHSREDLRRAMAALLERSDSALPPPMAAFAPLVGREPWPVAEKEAEILRTLLERKRLALPDLFQTCHSRSELVAAFLAVLELCRGGRIALEGGGEARDAAVSLLPMDKTEAGEPAGPAG